MKFNFWIGHQPQNFEARDFKLWIQVPYICIIGPIGFLLDLTKGIVYCFKIMWIWCNLGFLILSPKFRFLELFIHEPLVQKDILKLHKHISENFRERICRSLDISITVFLCKQFNDAAPLSIPPILSTAVCFVSTEWSFVWQDGERQYFHSKDEKVVK